jgi:hypothetical protein
MPKEKTPEQVYDELITQGMYEEANLDKDEIKKVLKLTMEDYEYGKKLRQGKDANWRVIFNIHYDAIRELCDQMMRLKRQKISNHQGLFAFIILNYPELDLDWNFFEQIRNTRNKNKYVGEDITKQKWKELELKFDIYISTLNKEIQKNIDLSQF